MLIEGPRSLRVSAYATRLTNTPPPMATDQVEARCIALPDGSLNRDLIEHLDGLRAYTWQTTNEQMTTAWWDLSEHIRQTAWYYAFSSSADSRAELQSWLTEVNGICFIDDEGCFDNQLRPLLPADGSASGQVPVPVEARERAARQRAYLATRGMEIPDSLPPVAALDEVLPQTNERIGLQILASALTGYFSAAVLAIQDTSRLNVADMRRDYPRAFAIMSAKQRQLFDNLDAELAKGLRWELVGAECLLWATGRMALTYPAEPTAADDIVAAAFALPEDEFVAATRLRSVPEILDEQERIHDLLWFVHESLLENIPVEDLNVDVVSERARALNWLCDRRFTDWDDVPTPT